MNISTSDRELALKGRLILKRRGKLCFEGNGSVPVELPAAAMEVLDEALAYISAGTQVRVVPEAKDLTTQQLADLLNVSRPFVIQLLESEKIPFRKVGKHRRVRLDDALQYKARIEKDRLKVLEKLEAEAQDLGFGY